MEAYNKGFNSPSSLITLKPTTTWALLSKSQGKLKEAIEADNRALATKPDYAEAFSNMGVSLKGQGKLKEAIEAYNKALAIKPDLAEAYNNKGRHASKTKASWQEAIEALQEGNLDYQVLVTPRRPFGILSGTAENKSESQNIGWKLLS